MYELKLGHAVMAEFPSEEEAKAEQQKRIAARPDLAQLLRVEPAMPPPPPREHPYFEPGTFLPRKRA